MEENEEMDLNPCSWIVRINIVYYGHPTKGNLQIQCNPHQNPDTIFQIHEKISSQIHLERQNTQNSKNNSSQ